MRTSTSSRSSWGFECSNGVSCKRTVSIRLTRNYEKKQKRKTLMLNIVHKINLFVRNNSYLLQIYFACLWWMKLFFLLISINHLLFINSCSTHGSSTLFRWNWHEDLSEMTFSFFVSVAVYDEDEYHDVKVLFNRWDRLQNIDHYVDIRLWTNNSLTWTTWAMMTDDFFLKTILDLNMKGKQWCLCSSMPQSISVNQ